MNAAQLLQDIILHTGMTQEQLARRLDVPVRTLSAWLHGHMSPRTKNQTAIQLLHQEVTGRSDISETELATTETTALSKRMTVKTLLANQNLLDALTLQLTYHTNAIEGSTMTLADVKEVLSDDNRVLANKTAREQIEARNHRTALYFLLDTLHDQADAFQWSEELILQTHVRLMNTLVSDAGLYRRHGVRIMGSRVTTVNHLRIVDKMTDLIHDMNTPPTEHRIEWLARTHATFEQIHPFNDGNGRTGRLLLFAQALQLGLMPPLVVKERKRAYYTYLERAQMHNELDALRLFIAESIIANERMVA
ncbi:MAG: Fic family protein [Candidatus Saccharibacteria bacterium]|nr:Fic family protein [Candidatus Saccharibacteria bacterium]